MLYLLAVQPPKLAGRYGAACMPCIGTLASSSPGNSHLDVVCQTVQATFSPGAEQRHHMLLYSRLLETPMEHKGAPSGYPTAHGSTTPTGQVPLRTSLYMLDHGRISGFPRLLHHKDVSPPLLLGVSAGRSLLGAHWPTYCSEGRPVFATVLQVNYGPVQTASARSSLHHAHTGRRSLDRLAPSESDRLAP